MLDIVGLSHQSESLCSLAKNPLSPYNNQLDNHKIKSKMLWSTFRMVGLESKCFDSWWKTLAISSTLIWTIRHAKPLKLKITKDLLLSHTTSNVSKILTMDLFFLLEVVITLLMAILFMSYMKSTKMVNSLRETSWSIQDMVTQHAGSVKSSS
jgi:hypothetical protein